MPRHLARGYNILHGTFVMERQRSRRVTIHDAINTIQVPPEPAVKKGLDEASRIRGVNRRCIDDAEFDDVVDV